MAETQKTSHKWEPIRDLPEDWSRLQSPEIQALAKVWREQCHLLEEKEALKVFNERLSREWAIETGIIERLYTLDRGITQVLIERGIDASFIPHGATDRPPELVVAMIRDHTEAVEGIFQFLKSERTLSTSFIKELHGLLTRHQEASPAVNGLGRSVEVPLLRGTYKKLSNNPRRPDGTIHEYCPPEQVASEMDKLIELHARHLRIGVASEVEAAWLHHRFAQIHPFQDGNGRVVRCLASLILLKAGWFPLVITRDDKERYLDALLGADRGDLKDLIQLFIAVEKRAFVRALGVAADVLKKPQASQLIDAVRERLLREREEQRKQWERAKDVASRLQDIGVKHLQEVATELKTKVGALESRYKFFVDVERPGGSRGYFFRKQIIETADKLRYWADFGAYRAWTRLVLQVDDRAEILLSYHGAGREYRGVLAISACFFRRTDVAEDEREITDVTPLSDEIFQVNYAEDLAAVKPRYEAWLEGILTRGLEAWRQG